MSGRRHEGYQRFRRRERRDREDWAAWCALAERYGPDWRSWTGPARDPRRAPGVLASGGPGLGPGGPGADPGFHAWLQWLADEQPAAAPRAARAPGLAPRGSPGPAGGAPPRGGGAAGDHAH